MTTHRSTAQGRAGRRSLATGRSGRPAAGALALPVWLAAFFGTIWFAAQDVGLDAQYLIGAAAIAGLFVLKTVRPTGFLKVFLILLIAFVSVRYFTWRTLYTLPPMDSAGFVPGLLLYLAELQGMVIYMLGVFVNIRPVNRPAAPLPADPALWPTVDVLVPSYNEDAELLRVTLTAATQIDYPADKRRVCLLDDGGTDQKCNDADPEKAASARARRAELQALCLELGVTYFTRARNVSAKAGNINSALPQTDGDLVLILDADHVPTQDILKVTAGHFLRDPDLFMVQTPHFFVTPDPVERNLDTFSKMPSENEMFYGVIQRGLDSWNASFFCGSAAVLRRRHLEAVGGISGDSITEDAETALELHSRGLKSLYIQRPMVAGLSPDTFAAFVTQRIRWAQGMIQILMLKNPLFKGGLSLAQRLCYLNSCIFWLFPLGRLVFLVAPLFYLFFGLKVFEASLNEFFAFALVHVLGSLMLSNHLFGRSRWPFVSDLYELVLSPFIFGAIFEVIRHPRRPQFKVTPKAEDVTQSFVSQLAKPFFVIMAVLIVGLGAGLYRYTAFPLERDHVTIVLIWHLINMALTLGALGVMYERAKSRDSERLWRDKPVNLVVEGGGVRATLVDTSIDGGRLVLPRGPLADAMVADGHAVIQACLPGLDEVRPINAVIEQHHLDGADLVVDVRYTLETAEDHQDLVRLCFGDSAVWADFQANRQRARSLPGALLYLIGRGGRRTAEMYRDRGHGKEIAHAIPAGQPGFAPAEAVGVTLSRGI